MWCICYSCGMNAGENLLLNVIGVEKIHIAVVMRTYQRQTHGLPTLHVCIQCLHNTSIVTASKLVLIINMFIVCIRIILHEPPARRRQAFIRSLTTTVVCKPKVNIH